MSQVPVKEKEKKLIIDWIYRQQIHPSPNQLGEVIQLFLEQGFMTETATISTPYDRETWIQRFTSEWL